MFLSGDTVYWAAASTGKLMATPFNNGSPDGTKTTVADSSVSWPSSGMFVLAMP
jgi:hypothetical protein